MLTDVLASTIYVIGLVKRIFARFKSEAVVFSYKIGALDRNAYVLRRATVGNAL